MMAVQVARVQSRRFTASLPRASRPLPWRLPQRFLALPSLPFPLCACVFARAYARGEPLPTRHRPPSPASAPSPSRSSSRPHPPRRLLPYSPRFPPRRSALWRVTALRALCPHLSSPLCTVSPSHMPCLRARRHPTVRPRHPWNAHAPAPVLRRSCSRTPLHHAPAGAAVLPSPPVRERASSPPV